MLVEYTPQEMKISSDDYVKRVQDVLKGMGVLLSLDKTRELIIKTSPANVLPLTDSEGRLVAPSVTIRGLGTFGFKYKPAVGQTFDRLHNKEVMSKVGPRMIPYMTHSSLLTYSKSPDAADQTSWEYGGVGTWVRDKFDVVTVTAE